MLHNLPSPKIESMLFNMVSITFFPFRSLEYDGKAASLHQILVEKIGAKEGDGSYPICELVAYTESLNFNWHKDAPQPYTNLEMFWNMVKDGYKFEEAFMFYRSAVDNRITDEWWVAKARAHKIWKPPEEKAESEKTEEELADPNSKSDNV